MATFKVRNTVINDVDIQPYIIAEIGVNYYEVANKLSLDLIDAAKLMIKEAKYAGANAVKFQIYKAEKLASRYAKAYWDLSANPVKNQFELFKKYDKLELSDYIELAKYAHSLDIDFIASIFDIKSLEIIVDYVDAIKIASADITNEPLLEAAAETSKPIILSTGASNIAEIYEAISIVNKTNNNIALLHCILEYPTPYEDANLNMIKYLKNVFPDYIIGYSDHTIPDNNMIVLTIAVILGARIIEKHFTLDKNLPGNDHFHSMDPADLRKFVENINLLKKILGKYIKEPIPGEYTARKYARRSIVALRPLNPGDVITLDDISIKRPGTGISPKYLKIVIGRRVKNKIEKDQPITWNDLY